MNKMDNVYCEYAILFVLCKMFVQDNERLFSVHTEEQSLS